MNKKILSSVISSSVVVACSTMNVIAVAEEASAENSSQPEIQKLARGSEGLELVVVTAQRRE